MTILDGLAIAVVHEWVASRSGSEQVFEHLARTFPSADLYALSMAPDVPLDVGGRTVSTTFLDRPFARSQREFTLPVMPLAWHRVDAPAYDVVITSSHAFSRWFGPARAAVHLSYVHAPARYLWNPELDQRVRRAAWLIRGLGAPLRSLDRRSVSWTDSMAANSRAVAGRVHDHYGVDARVIHPPVDVGDFRVGTPSERKHVLALSRFVPYKRLDLAIDACEHAGLPLVVAGRGPLAGELERRASRAGAQLVVAPSRAQVIELLATAMVLVFPAEEDFGLVPVEALAAGTPVLGLARGGVLDTVEHGRTGILVDEQTPSAFADALAQTSWDAFDHQQLRKSAERFAPDRFASNVMSWVEDVLDSRREGAAP